MIAIIAKFLPMNKDKSKSFFEKVLLLVKHPFNREHKPVIHTTEWIFVLLAFFAIGFSVMYHERVTMFLEKAKLVPPESK
jgi:hypothetical protein